MPKLLLQRLDAFGIGDKYRVYINRSRVAKIGFAEKLELDLPPGRYNMSVGGRRALDGETWFELEKYNRAFVIDSKPAGAWRNFPKNRQIQLIEKGPIQLPGKDAVAKHKQHYFQTLAMQVFFNLIMLAGAILMLYYFVKQNYDYSFLVIAFGVLAVLLWINHGIRRNLYQRNS